MEVVFSFDDTGSMASARAQVKREIRALIPALRKADPGVKIGILIHLDYCDKDIIDYLDLTTDDKLIDKFINKKLDGYGGDADECYELALNYIHSKFSWSSDKRVAIVIGDCEPHKVGYSVRRPNGEIYKNTLNWREEAQKCVDKGIKVQAVQALGRYGEFYAGLAKIAGTQKLDLSQFAHINQFITAIVHNENGTLEEYENSEEIFKTNNSFKRMFARLRGEEAPEEKESEKTAVHRRYGKDIGDPKDFGTGDGTKTIDIDSRFQVLEVGASPRIIKEFVEDNGAAFKKGRGFYQFILTETIQENKEILMVHKKTGETKADTVWCRNQIGCPLGTRGRVNPKSLDVFKEYDIFIQSTSYNRKLDPNTKFLYELEHK